MTNYTKGLIAILFKYEWSDETKDRLERHFKHHGFTPHTTNEEQYHRLRVYFNVTYSTPQFIKQSISSAKWLIAHNLDHSGKCKMFIEAHTNE